MVPDKGVSANRRPALRVSRRGMSSSWGGIVPCLGRFWACDSRMSLRRGQRVESFACLRNGLPVLE